MRHVETFYPSKVVEALERGDKAYIPGGYHTKEERASLAKLASELAGREIRVRYTGPDRHRYYFEFA